MGNQLPLLSGRELVAVLTKFGYQVVRQRGSHMRLEAKKRNPITVPDYREIDRSLIRKILRDAHITVEEFTENLK